MLIANAAGFYGDRIDAAHRIVDHTELDYLTFDYLAELTMSILARSRQKDPARGFASDFVDVVRALGPALYLQPQLRLISNAGGVNPIRCVEAIAVALIDSGSPEMAIAVVLGDNLLDRLEELLAHGCPLQNLDTGAPFSELHSPTVAANAYLGAAPIAAALAGDARLVVTGRVADAALTVGPAIYECGIPLDRWNDLAMATVAGHLIECGAQVTGGYASQPVAWPLANIGYPIVDMTSPDRFTITKPPLTDGAVNRQTVVEQLVYEVGNPQHYLTPDVDVDLTTVRIAEEEPDRVAVWGAQGGPPPSSYKVSLAYHAGYTTTAELLVYGRDCIRRGHELADLVLTRTAAAGRDLQRSHVELLGSGIGVPSDREISADPPEVVLRISVADPDRSLVDRFAREIPPLITTGPAGIAGYASGRPRTRPMYAYWPTTVPKDLVEPAIEIRSARDWVG